MVFALFWVGPTTACARWSSGPSAIAKSRFRDPFVPRRHRREVGSTANFQISGVSAFTSAIKTSPDVSSGRSVKGTQAIVWLQSGRQAQAPSAMQLQPLEMQPVGTPGGHTLPSEQLGGKQAASPGRLSPGLQAVLISTWLSSAIP